MAKRKKDGPMLNGEAYEAVVEAVTPDPLPEAHALPPDDEPIDPVARLVAENDDLRSQIKALGDRLASVESTRSASEESEILREVEEAEAEVAEAERAALDAKSHAKSKEKAFDSKVDDLRALIREAKKRYPLFRKPDAEPAPSDASPSPEAEAAPAEPWRSEPVTKLALADTIHAKLLDAGLTTLGHLADWSKSGKLLTDIPGIGDAKATLIEDASAAFWEARTFDAGDFDASAEDDEPEPDDEPDHGALVPSEYA